MSIEDALLKERGTLKLIDRLHRLGDDGHRFAEILTEAAEALRFWHGAAVEAARIMLVRQTVAPSDSGSHPQGENRSEAEG